MENPAYQGKFVRVTEEEIEGSVYERVYLRHALTVLPIDNKGRVLFIKERRLHETPSIRWKPVTGFLEEYGTVEENANRELQEEIGKIADSIQPYFHVRHTGTLNLEQHFVIARGLRDNKLPNPDGENSIIEVAALGLDEILKRALDGEFARGTVGFVLMKLYYEIKNGIIEL